MWNNKALEKQKLGLLNKGLGSDTKKHLKQSHNVLIEQPSRNWSNPVCVSSSYHQPRCIKFSWYPAQLPKLSCLASIKSSTTFYNTLQSLLRSWSIPGRSVSPGKALICSKCFPCVYKCSLSVSLESCPFKNGPATLSSMMDVIEFIHLSLSLLWLGPDVPLIKFSLLHSVRKGISRSSLGVSA